MLHYGPGEDMPRKDIITQLTRAFKLSREVRRPRCLEPIQRQTEVKAHQSFSREPQPLPQNLRFFKQEVKFSLLQATPKAQIRAAKNTWNKHKDIRTQHTQASQS